ncbi:undecaprenyldiphospho-muramoylpentapeptide beta-N-acetylglucosaminyltransferase [Thermodesulfobacteriota bacterium]
MDPQGRLEKKRQDTVRIIIAGGGTGGHLFPGVAIGKEILSRYSGAEILFVTGDRKIESDILTRAGFNNVSISVEGIKGRGWKKAIKAMLKLPYGFAQSVKIIKRFSPHLVLGVGGYSAGPVCPAAWIMGKPTALHEQNSFPGLTNRLLCRIVDRVFISFEESRKHFPKGTVFLTGNPIRKEFLEVKDTSGKTEKRFTILVTGGSQGAIAINRAFVAALVILRRKGKDPMVIHHTGEADYTRVVHEYRKKGLRGDVTPFIQDMPEAYRQSDIFVGRSGAGTVFELAGLGKPSILIPYPHAANRHQEANAGVLGGVGGAEILLQDDLTAEMLAEFLTRYMDDRSALKKMGEQARKVGRRDAAKVIVDQLEEMIAKHYAYYSGRQGQ